MNTYPYQDEKSTPSSTASPSESGDCEFSSTEARPSQFYPPRYSYHRMGKHYSPYAHMGHMRWGAPPPMHPHVKDPFYAEMHPEKRRRSPWLKIAMGTTALLAASTVFYCGRAYELHSLEENGYAILKHGHHGAHAHNHHDHHHNELHEMHEFREHHDHHHDHELKDKFFHAESSHHGKGMHPKFHGKHGDHPHASGMRGKLTIEDEDHPHHMRHGGKFDAEDEDHPHHMRHGRKHHGKHHRPSKEEPQPENPEEPETPEESQPENPEEKLNEEQVEEVLEKLDQALEESIEQGAGLQ